MKKLVILCAVILVILLPLVSLVGCKKQPEPTPAPTTTTPAPTTLAPAPPIPKPDMATKVYNNTEHGSSVEYPAYWDLE